MSRRLMIVEDEAILALALKSKLQDLGYLVVSEASDAREAVEGARHMAPELVLMDIRLGHGPDGIEAADIVRKELNLPVVFLTAHSDEATLERAKNHRAVRIRVEAVSRS